jgi:hypothetical protein
VAAAAGTRRRPWVAARRRQAAGTPAGPAEGTPAGPAEGTPAGPAEGRPCPAAGRLQRQHNRSKPIRASCNNKDYILMKKPRVTSTTYRRCREEEPGSSWPVGEELDRRSVQRRRPGWGEAGRAGGDDRQGGKDGGWSQRRRHFNL